MKTIDRLKRRAIFACNYRGHTMKRFIKHNDNLYESTCKKCNAYVTVIPKLLPNEINIGGTAVALDCE